jgi:formamidopyrimidine-DNA glycosylase
MAPRAILLAIMPELPEVESAARFLDTAIAGRILRAVQWLHPSLERTGAEGVAGLIGFRVEQVTRVAKWQELRFVGGAVLVVHFRMTGDWAVTRSSLAPRHARAHFTFSGNCHLWLVDPRVLARVEVRAVGDAPRTIVGPDAMDPRLDAGVLRARFAKRRAPIKQVLLDQSVIAGVGNIYAAEALWHARIDPRTPAQQLSRERVERVLVGIRWTMGLAFDQMGLQRYGEALDRLAAYDREGEPCRRCGTAIARIAQGQRSTYFCRRCQR